VSLRIARVLTRLNLGGPARQVLASDPRLVARGHMLRVFAGEAEPGEGDLTAALAARGVEVVTVPGLGRAIRPWRDFAAARSLRRELTAFQPDIVHTHASKAGLLGRRAASGANLNARTVHSFHGHVLEGYFPPTTSRLLVHLEAWLARRTDALIAVSEATADDLARLGVAPRERFRIVPPGVELEALSGLAPPDEGGHTSSEGDAFRRELGVPRDAPLVLVLGRLAPVKRPTLALQIFVRIASAAPTAHLVFVGDGVMRSDLERERQRTPEAVRARVHLAGAREAIAPVLAAADIVLSTSHSEGLPVALIEAAAAARPVVSTAVGGVAELVTNGVTGLLAVEEEGLALALESLLGDPTERRRMGLAARAVALRTHGAEALTQRLEALYLRLVGDVLAGDDHHRTRA